jgi:hypothetical protein
MASTAFPVDWGWQQAAQEILEGIAADNASGAFISVPKD